MPFFCQWLAESTFKPYRKVGMKSTKIVVHPWPGGIPTLAGGTRTAIKIDRPWQARLNINIANCPFEPLKVQATGRQILDRSQDGSWVSFDNRFTPFPDHTLFVPTTCQGWDEEKIRMLGGRENISTALALAHRAIRAKKEECVSEIVANMGWSGGQNVAHLHWHALTIPPEVLVGQSEQIADFMAATDPALTIFEEEGLRVTVGGHRAGQCFIVPTGEATSENLATAIKRLVTLFTDKFRSRVGERLPPDYTLALVFKGDKFAYGIYVPVLNHWGATEYLALLGQQTVTLPWPHELTAAYLRGEVARE